MDLEELYKLLQTKHNLAETVGRLEYELEKLNMMSFEGISFWRHRAQIKRTEKELRNARQRLEVVGSIIQKYCKKHFKRKYYNELFK